MNDRFDRAAHGDDVQAIVRTAFATLPHCRYLLLAIDDPVRARSWIAQLVEQSLVKSVNDVGASKGTQQNTTPILDAALVAFSYAGLRRLGLREHSEFPFPTPFRSGMASPIRAPLLGDRNREAWTWGDVASESKNSGNDFEADLLVAHYRKNPFDDSEGILRPQSLPDFGLRAIKVVATCPFYMESGSEPFGFKDGIAQPRIPGLREGAAKQQKSRGPDADANAVAPGEFILGQVNAYGERAYCPDVVGWREYANRKGSRFALNGSYLAVRQIEQDVAAFRQFDPALASAKPENPPTFAEKIIGRRKGGEPLVARTGIAPERGPIADSFGFRVGDSEGFQCPRGSHIRRANPRDALGWDPQSGVSASKLHRLLRRGRVYMDVPVCGSGAAASCAVSAKREDCGKGLFFIALNADLDRQFEFVQQRWISSAKFADLWDETDPALGAGSGREFSMPGCAPIGKRLTGLPQFTTVKGGGYFFMPSLSALRFIAEGRGAEPTMTANQDPRSKNAAQAWMQLPEVCSRKEPPAGVFEIGLSLGGTVSAGAYTAGVLDFLVEALDQWEQARGKGDVPQHEVRLRVLTGTSGGGVCAATLAKALAYRFAPERIKTLQDPPRASSINPLYRLWVHGFDVHDLAAVATGEDIPPLKSLLHPGPSTNRFQDLPPNAEGERIEAAAPRAWVDDPLTLIVTLTNVTGVPYSVPYEGESGRGQSYKRHADYARFEFYFGQASAYSTSWPDAFAVRAHPDATLPVHDRAGRPRTSVELSWDDAWQFVRATSAFPVMFPPIELARPAWHYLYQPIMMTRPAGSGCVELEARVFEPAWSNWKQNPLADFRFVAIDGGTLNNGPIELARRELAGLVGCNARAPNEARRAVIHIDPFASEATPAAEPAASLQATASASISALISHARFSTQDFYLAAEPEGRSRFLVSAVRSAIGRTVGGEQALASGSVGMFGGFLSAWYRHHDFMLGRRNCQQFLRRHFTLAAGNPSLRDRAASGKVPIIPLLGSAAVEQIEPDWPVEKFDPDRAAPRTRSVRDAFRGRIAHVYRLALEPFGGRLLIALLLLLPRFVTTRLLTHFAVKRLLTSLRDHGLSA